jgi:hypothetical protein
VWRKRLEEKRQWRLQKERKEAEWRRKEEDERLRRLAMDHVNRPLPNADQSHTAAWPHLSLKMPLSRAFSFDRWCACVTIIEQDIVVSPRCCLLATTSRDS